MTGNNNPIIYKSSVAGFAQEATGRVYMVLVTSQAMQGILTNGYLHLCGYNEMGFPIALRAQIFSEHTYGDEEKRRAKSEEVRDQVEPFLKSYGLELMEGTFELSNTSMLGVLGDLTPQEPVSTTDRNPLAT